MIRSAEGTGKTIDLAKAAALAELGITDDADFSTEIIAVPKSGFLGFGKVDAKVRVSIEVPDAPAPKAEKKPEAPKAAPAPKAEKKPESPKAAPAPKAEKKPAEPKPTAEPQDKERAEKVKTFLQGLMQRMEIEATVTVTEKEDGSLYAELAGPDMGAVIGRRGETLDAIQHLVNYSVNRGSDKHEHISVDAENYRSKREESLARLAEKMAAKALKYKRSMALEPMNSYERHVIHTALQNYEGVTTASIGTEPNRRVVVSVVGAEEEHHDSRRSGSRSGNRSGRGGRDQRRGGSRPQGRREAPKAAAPAETKPAEEKPAAPAAPVQMPEGYEPPVKNKPVSREWC